MESIEEINKKLREVQSEWYKELRREYGVYGNHNEYSSPFCCGVSPLECNNVENIIMFCGEEARGWWFDEESRKDNVEYLQGYSIAYLEKQLCKEFEFSENQFSKHYPNSFKKKNSSSFWSFIKKIKKVTGMGVCWNNIDKVHGIKWGKNNRKTKCLDDKEQGIIHSIKVADGDSLLLREIKIINPKAVILTRYENSIKKAFGLDFELCDDDKICVDVSDLFRDKLENTKVIFLKYHPSYIVRKKKYKKAIDELEEILNS